MKIKMIVVNNMMYLAKLNVDGDTITLTDAYSCKGENATLGTLKGYVKSKNLGNLGTVEFNGRNVTYSVTEFSARQKLDFKVVKMNMRRAKVLALPSLENEKLEELLGK